MNSPVPLDELYDYIQSNKMNNNAGFKKEFKVSFSRNLFFILSSKLVFIFFLIIFYLLIRKNKIKLPLVIIFFPVYIFHFLI